MITAIEDIKMEWQSTAVVICIALAVTYFVYTTWRTWRSSSTGCGGCGCAKSQIDVDEPASRLELPVRSPSERPS